VISHKKKCTHFKRVKFCAKKRHFKKCSQFKKRHYCRKFKIVQFCKHRKTLSKCVKFHKKKYCTNKRTIPRRCLKKKHFRKCIRKARGRKICRKYKLRGGKKICFRIAKKRICLKKKKICRRKIDGYGLYFVYCTTTLRLCLHQCAYS